VSAAFEEIRRIDSLLSVHRPDSELSRVNALAARQNVPVSEDLLRVLAQAEEISVRTGGAFDVTVKPVLDLWGFIWKEYRLPTEDELKAVLPRVDYKAVLLDTRRRMVRFARPGVQVDLGGIGKGYAVDCAIDKLRSFGLANAMVRAGGDLRVMGAPPGHAAWEVQLEDPEKQGNRPSIWLRDAAISTSGNYENFFEVSGRRFSHIIDPRTGMPVEQTIACSVIASTCMESDAWATACFVFGVEAALKKFGDQMAVRFTTMPTQPDSPLRIVRSRRFELLAPYRSTRR
jgi:thiamine biosynthesis lipoprotein ApbE